MSKPSKSQPYVTRLPDGGIYSQHRIPPAPDADVLGQPTVRALDLLQKQEKREGRRLQLLKERTR